MIPFNYNAHDIQTQRIFIGNIIAIILINTARLSLNKDPNRLNVYYKSA